MTAPFLLGLLATLLPGSPSIPSTGQELAAPPDHSATLERLADQLEAQRLATHVVGMAIAVVQDDEVVFARGFGSADLEAGRPVTPETLFAIGSTTKAFTSTCIGMLVDEGRMDWDDPIVEHLPEFRLSLDGGDGEAPGPEAVTVRDLLTHRTGFTRMGVLWAAGTADRATILATATGAEPWAPFREGFFYNNVMYLAAGEASAAVAGISWDELVTERLLEPLGMESSTTTIDGLDEDPRLALGYRWDPDAERAERDPMRSLDGIAPAGSINSNVVDMAQWLRLLLGRGELDGKRLISAERLEDTWEPQISIEGELQYGLGWMLERWEGERVVQHGGNIDGFSAMVALVPERDLGFVLLTNASSTALQGSCRGIVWETLLGEPAPDADAPTASPSDLGDYVGSYLAQTGPFAGEELTVSEKDGSLALDVPSQMVFDLKAPDEEGLWPFAIQPTAIQASFVRDESSAVVQLNVHQNGLVFEVPRVGVERTADGTRAEFARYLGTYSHPMLPEPFTVSYLDGRLACDIPGQMVFELHPPDAEGLWKFRATDALALEFHADETGAVTKATFHERGTELECPLLSRAEEGEAEVLPSVDELLALRGADTVAERLRALGPLRVTGRVRLVHAGLDGRFVELVVPGGAFRSEEDFGDFGWSTTAFDGTRGWTDSAFEPFDEQEGDALAQLRLSHPGVLFGDWREHFDALEVTGGRELDGRACWSVRLQAGDLPAWTAHVDAESGDLLQVDAKTRVPGLGTMEQTIRLSDYRERHGLRMPFRVATEHPATGRTVVTYEEIEVRVAVSGDAFDPPR